MIKWNRFDTDCKNERAIFTRWISFTGPLSLQINRSFGMSSQEFDDTVDDGSLKNIFNDVEIQ